MDDEIRALERALNNSPEDRDLAEKLGALYERAGWTLRGQTIQEWIDALARESEREEAARALAAIGPAARRGLPALLEVFCWPCHDGPWRSAAADALVAIGAGDEPELIAALIAIVEREVIRPRGRGLSEAEHFEHGLIWNSALLLGRLGARAAIPALIGALERPVYLIRAHVAEALGAIGDAAAAPPLRAALEHPDIGLALAAARGLARLADPDSAGAIAERLPQMRAEVRIALVETFGALRDERGVQAFEALFPYLSELARRQALAALARMPGERALAMILAAFDDPQARVRKSAAEACGLRGEEAALPLLLPALGDEDAVARAAGEAVGLIGGPELVPDLIEDLGVEHRRLGAAVALRGLRAREAAEALRPLAFDGREALRLEVIAALGDLDDAASAPALIWGCRGPGDRVRAACAEALGRLSIARGDRAICEALVALLERSAWPVSRAAAEALGSCHADARAPLLRALESHPEAQVQEAAARSLLRLDPQRGREHLLAILRRPLSDDEPEELRAAAAKALEGLHGPEDDLVPDFLAAVVGESWPLRCALIPILGRLGDPRARPALREALGDFDEIGELAARALAEIEGKDRMRPPAS